MPPSAAAIKLQIIASPITMPSPGTLNQTYGGNAGDDGEGDTIEHPDEKLAQDDAARIGVAERLRRQRAHGDRHGLRGGIAALARDDRRQHRQRHHLLQLALEQAKHG